MLPPTGPDFDHWADVVRRLIESAKKDFNFPFKQEEQPRPTCGAERAALIGLQGATHRELVDPPVCCRGKAGTRELAARGAMAKACLVWLST